MFIQSQLVNTAKAPPNTTTVVAQLRESSHDLTEEQARELLNTGGTLL